MIVFDSSTLILLAKVELLARVIEETKVVVTDVVETECIRKQDLLDAKLIKRLIEEGKVKVEKHDSGKEERKIGKDFNMGVGEVSSLLLAKKKGWILATDDRQALKTCKILKVPFLTAIHFLLRLYEKGTISRELALAKLTHLEKVGRYSPEIIRNVSEKIRERES
jgi:predicted nucleic acid-binding protein